MGRMPYGGTCAPSKRMGLVPGAPCANVRLDIRDQRFPPKRRHRMRTQQAPTRPALMIAAALIAAGLSATPAHAVRPIVFVHGGSGSGAQFESQAMRYA